MHRFRRAATLALAGTLVLSACETDEEITSDPQDLQEPADDPDGVDAPLQDEPESGEGDPVVEGDDEGRLDPDEQDEEDLPGD